MRLWWTERQGGRKRERTASRPRVAQAVQRAHAAALGADAGLGSASADMGVLRHFEALDRAAASGPLHKARRRAERGLNPDLLFETARAARTAGRRPEEVWAEALREWLMAQTLIPDEAPRPLVALTRRQQTWREIETTMQALRAS